MSSLRRTGMPVPERNELILRVEQAISTPCVYCNDVLTAINISLDHKHPKNRGGDNSLDNIQFTCKKCNKIKGEFTHDEFEQLMRFLNVPKRAELKRILIKRLGMGNFLFGRRK